MLGRTQTPGESLRQTALLGQHEKVGGFRAEQLEQQTELCNHDTRGSFRSA